MKQITIAVSRFNEMITHGLLQGCVQTLEQHGLSDQDYTVYWVPGAYELPVVAQALAKKQDCVAVICLGAVIRGDTPHFDYICEQTAAGLMRVSLDEQLPVVFGVLTTDTLEQAQQRSCEPGSNKGEEAALCALEMIDVLTQIPKDSHHGPST